MFDSIPFIDMEFPSFSLPSLTPIDTQSLPVSDIQSLSINNTQSLPFSDTQSLPAIETPTLPSIITPSLPSIDMQALNETVNRVVDDIVTLKNIIQPAVGKECRTQPSITDTILDVLTDYRFYSLLLCCLLFYMTGLICGIRSTMAYFKQSVYQVQVVDKFSDNPKCGKMKVKTNDKAKKNTGKNKDCKDKLDGFDEVAVSKEKKCVIDVEGEKCAPEIEGIGVEDKKDCTTKIGKYTIEFRGRTYAECRYCRRMNVYSKIGDDDIVAPTHQDLPDFTVTVPQPSMGEVLAHQWTRL